ncbi:MAG: hypothetical protein RLZZ304_113 [Actinomycetota bacterium]|jgi:hypothetical protein
MSRQITPETGLQGLADRLVAELVGLVDNGIATPILLIDGRAGSGKSTLAELVKNGFFKAGESAPRVVHMDDLYQGWNGLDAGADYLNRFVIAPIGKREGASWQEWSWAEDARSGEWREFRGGTPLIVEGCGSLNGVSSQAAHIRVWLEVPEGVRHQRWLDREGNDEFWARWSAQEVEFYAREKSDELADIVAAN